MINKMSFLAHNYVELPLIDMSQPLLPSTLSYLSQACKEWGFFHITNHGVSEYLYDRLHALSKKAFDLPLDVKLKLGPSSSINTYTPHFIASPFFESLRVAGPDFFSSAKSTCDVLFEPSNTEFRDILEEYGKTVMELSKRIMAIILNCLGDEYETKYLESEFGECHGYLRINNYSRHENINIAGAMVEEEEEEEEETELGLGMHTDMSCITIVYQDDVGGLQVRSKEGEEWLDIVPIEGRLVVNIGDLLQAWSNGRVRSSQHRVVLRRPPVPRLSLAFFWCFEDEKVILAPKEVVVGGEGEKKRVYRPFVCREYLKYRENSEKGRFDKVGYTIDDFGSKE